MSSLTRKIGLYDDGIGFVELVDNLGSDLSVVNSARVSFGSHKEEIDEKDERLIKYLIDHRHTSTLEHCVATFRVKAPLFVRSQHHRHRTWAYNEISRRYTEINLEFYEPKKFRKQSDSNRQASTDEIFDPIMPVGMSSDIAARASDILKEHHDASLYIYSKLLEAGVCREQARGALPQNMYTEYYATANLNNILKFIDLRTHSGAQWEIQQLANGILDIVSKIYPITVRHYKKRKKEM
jgi:thymidylate synthase (FAD)|tara:strand:- start:3294 stop:4010 length:717 start_codon:yes stop_codon:yes gene_type:complete